MGLCAFAEFCIHMLDQPHTSDNPYVINPAADLDALCYCDDFWYGVVCTREWALSLYGASAE